MLDRHFEISRARIVLLIVQSLNEARVKHQVQHNSTDKNTATDKRCLPTSTTPPVVLPSARIPLLWQNHVTQDRESNRAMYFNRPLRQAKDVRTICLARVVLLQSYPISQYT